MAELKKIDFCTRVDFNSMIVDCLGCKWTIILIENIDREINRPGQLVKVAEGLTTKVLNQCLNRMISYGIIEKKSSGVNQSLANTDSLSKAVSCSSC